MSLQIERLKTLHSLGFVHNDLKPQNIVVGHHDSSTISLIDFGLSSRYLAANGDHIKKENLGSFSGNAMFASLNSCRGGNKSRRDDIESAFYVLLYLINQQTLPWSRETPRRREQDLKQRIESRLKKKSL